MLKLFRQMYVHLFAFGSKFAEKKKLSWFSENLLTSQKKEEKKKKKEMLKTYIILRSFKKKTIVKKFSIY